MISMEIRLIMNSNVDCSIIKDGKVDEIKTLMRGLCKSCMPIETMHVMFEMRQAALELCRRGEITLERMKLFFPSDILKGPVENISLMEEMSAFGSPSIPESLVLKCSEQEGAVVGIFSLEEVLEGCIFEGPERKEDGWENEESSWMRYVNRVEGAERHNLEAFERGGRACFRATKHIPPLTELLVGCIGTPSSPYNGLKTLRGTGDYKEDCTGDYKEDCTGDCTGDYKEDCTGGCNEEDCTGGCNEEDCSERLLLESDKSLLKPNMEECVEDGVGNNCNGDVNVRRRRRRGGSEAVKGINVASKKYPCTVCNYSTNKKSTFVAHWRTHTGERPYKCDSCDSTFAQVSSLRKHSSTHSAARPFKCDTCAGAFARSGDLLRHKRTHSAEKAFKSVLIKSEFREVRYQCDSCEYATPTKASFKNHLRTHTGEKPYNCDLCGKAFSQKSHVQRHKRAHTGEKPYKCHFCDKAFSFSHNLQDHKRIHTRETPFQCDICLRAFTRKLYLKVHSRVHTGERPYKCDVCERAFTLKNNLRLHKFTHTGEKPYKCDVCGSSFAQGTNLKSHKRIHMSDKNLNCDVSDKDFKCDISDKDFPQSSPFHKLTHAGEEPHRCDICDRTFAQRCYLVTHKRIHTDHLRV